MVSLGELLTIIIMAFALSMDAFSVSIGLGVYIKRLKFIFWFGILIGLFHILMPFLGLMLGTLIYERFAPIASFIGGGLLLLLGAQMLISSRRESEPWIPKRAFSFVVFAFSVSIDSFSVGLSLGMFGAKTLLTIVLFGTFSALLTWCGMLIGRRVHSMISSYGEAFGGVILIVFGLHLIWPI